MRGRGSVQEFVYMDPDSRYGAGFAEFGGQEERDRDEIERMIVYCVREVLVSRDCDVKLNVCARGHRVSRDSEVESKRRPRVW